MNIRQDCLDSIPQSPYQENSGSDQMWRMGYADGMDNDPVFGSMPHPYREGYAAGRKHSEQFGM